MDANDAPAGQYFYFGNLSPHEPQYMSGLFRGLAISSPLDRDILHDARNPLPFQDCTVAGFQSQDVFEHIEYEKIPNILDEIYRCLYPGGIFRLSLPDYNSPVYRNRSVYNSDGEILCDLVMGGSVSCDMNRDIKVEIRPGHHIWFPTYSNVLPLILKSQIRKCEIVTLHQAWKNQREYICKAFDESIMPVYRTPPHDMRAGGKPISLVIDFTK